MNWLYIQKSFNSINDWYKLEQKDFFDYSGRGLYSYYNCYTLKILEDTYPNIEWYGWLFRLTPNGFWNDLENQKKYMKWLENKLSIKTLDDWYNYDGKIIEDNHGIGLIANQYNSSLHKLLYSLYPEYKFILYKFKIAPHKYWMNKENIINYLNDLYNYKKFTNIEDWYKITRNDFVEYYGNGLLDRYGSHMKIIIDNINYNWNKLKFIKAGYSTKACSFLNRLSLAINYDIRHKLNNIDGEKKIDDTNYSTDGFIENYNGFNIYIEYNGCCYHGCLKCYPNQYEKCWFANKTYGELYTYTQKRKNDIKKKDKKIIIIDIWECEDTNKINLKEWFDLQINNFNN
jgi:hypothetical protein